LGLGAAKIRQGGRISDKKVGCFQRTPLFGNHAGKKSVVLSVPSVMRYLLLLSALCWLCPFRSWAQTGSDSLLEVRHETVERAIDWQNEGFRKEELENDLQRALLCTDSALSLWVALQEPLEIANLRKFKGYLLGRMGDFPGGKKELYEALSAYTRQQAAFGVAATQYDLGRLCMHALDYDSAVHYTRTALRFWDTEKQDYRRLLGRNQLIYLETWRLNFPEAERLQAEAAALLETGDFHWQGTLDFYFVSAAFYEQQARWQSYESYRKRYLQLLDTLQKDGVKTSSYFERMMLKP